MNPICADPLTTGNWISFSEDSSDLPQREEDECHDAIVPDMGNRMKSSLKNVQRSLSNLLWPLDKGSSDLSPFNQTDLIEKER